MPSGYVGFYDKPWLKFERILDTYIAVAPRGFGSFLRAGLLWIKEKLFAEQQIPHRFPLPQRSVIVGHLIPSNNSLSRPIDVIHTEVIFPGLRVTHAAVDACKLPIVPATEATFDSSSAG